MFCPERLRPRDRVRIIAPSSPFDHALVRRGIAWLGERYRVECDPAIFGRPGLLAGNDARRLAELNAALRAPDVRAIVAARGGYGLTRIAHLADWAALRRHPKWLVGFSDVTALHVEAQRSGCMSLHAHNVAGLGRGDAAAREEWLDALENPDRPARFDGLVPWRRGRAKGPLTGGNLTLLFTCAAARRLWLPPGAIVFLEDIGEASYRVDRMLSALIASGAFDRASGFLIGTFTDCPPGHGIDVHDVLRERLLTLRVPVSFGLPSGHARRNRPLRLGADAEIDDTVAVVPGATTP